jgi:hypothetical protein
VAKPTLIYTDAPGAVPATFRLPPGFDMQLSSISATFDGAGASGTFYPCVAVYSQDGKLIGRYFPSQTMTTADSGEVTYGPF